MADFVELFDVIGNTTAGATHSERRANNTGETNSTQYVVGLVHAGCNFGTWTFQTNFAHGVIEAIAVLSFVYGVSRRADKLNPELFQYAFFIKLQRTIQCCLTAHRR